MAIPDLNDRSHFPAFVDLPEVAGGELVENATTTGPVLIAHIKDNMTITKPTLVLADRDGHPFALVFDGFDRDGLDLAQRGLKKGATAIIRNARQTVPPPATDLSLSGGAETMTSKAARRPFVRIAAGQAHTVHAVPARLEQTLAAADALRRRQTAAAPAAVCDACGAADGEKLLKCTGCQQAQYCNQTTGWTEGHKGECKAWRALTTIWA